MKNRVFGNLTKRYSERGCDVYCSDDKIWVVMLKNAVIGFTWLGYNGLTNIKEAVSSIIKYYDKPEKAVWI